MVVITALEDASEDAGIPRKSYHIVDGSGLTRNTHVTPRQMLTILTSAYRDFSIAPEFIASLGIAGEDGRREAFSKLLARRAFAREDWHSGRVSSLAGFAPSADGEMLAFVILLNDSRGKYGRMTAWVDEIASAVGRFSRH